MQLDTLFAQLHNLPNVPEVAQVLIRQFDDPNTSIETLSRTVARDPVIAAKVLRLANSARFRGARESTSIEDAALGPMPVQDVRPHRQSPFAHGLHRLKVAWMWVAAHRNAHDAKGEIRRQIGQRPFGPFASGRGIADEADRVPCRCLEAGQVDHVAEQAADGRPEDVKDAVTLTARAEGGQVRHRGHGEIGGQ